MAKIEVDEIEWANSQRVVKIATEVGKHPKARALMQQAVAEAVPEEAGPETRLRSEFADGLSRIEKRLDEEAEERRKEREESAADRKKREIEAQWERGQEQLRASGYTPEGIEAVQKLMTDRGIPDHEAAAALHERLNPPAEPVAAGTPYWDFFNPQGNGDNGLELLLKGDEEGFLRKTLPGAIAEGRAMPRRG